MEESDQQLPGQKTVTYFSHVPKTAGTSFIVILDRFFHADDIFHPQLWWDVGDVNAVRTRQFQCFRGHFGMGGQVLSEHPMQVLTLLRDPISLAHSTYQYVKRDTNAKKHGYLHEHNLSFEAFLLDPKTQNLASDRLFKSLTFAIDLKEVTPGLSVDVNNYRAFRKQSNESRRSMSVAAKLQLAKQYLSECLWVGLQEHFEVALLMLSYQMAWPPIGPTSKLNQFKQAPQISDQAKASIKKLNQLDHAIYDWAKAEFEQKLITFCTDLGLTSFDIKLATERVDRHYQQHYLEKNKLRLTAGIRYNFSMVLLGTNWHRRETISETNQVFRWTGPENQCSIDFWLLPKAYQVQISYINVSTERLLDELSLQVNGHELDWSHIRQGSGGVITCQTEKGMTSDDGLFRLTLNTSELVSHAAVLGSDDERKVGFAINQIVVKATGYD